MSILEKERKKLLEVLPLPLACSYQELLLENALWKKGKGSKENVVWKWLENSQLLIKLVSLLSLSTYLDIYQEQGDWELHRSILDCLKEPGSESYLVMSQAIVEYLQAHPHSENKLPGLSALLEYNLTLVPTSLVDCPDVLPIKKSYNWFEIVSFLVKGENHFKGGAYSLHLPLEETLSFYIYLLETALHSCSFFQDYGIYVLVSRDDRKTRGFICQGTRSKPMGIRWISAMEWNQLRGKPFFCLEGQKQYLPLFPLAVPLLHKHGDRMAFSDLLLYEHGTNDKIIYHSYRSGKLFHHEHCAQGALAQWQKTLRFLERSASKIQEKRIRKTKDDYISCKKFVGRENVFESICNNIAYNPSGYLYIQAEAGYGKTSLFQELRLREQNKSLKKMGNSFSFVWYFLNSSYPQDDPVDIFISFYVQIWEKIYNKSREEIQNYLQKLPLGLQNLEKSFPSFLQECSKEILKPREQKLVIVLDAIDSFDFFSSGPADLLCILPQKLPENVFFLFSRCKKEKKTMDDISLITLCKQENLVKEICSLEKLSFSDISQWLSHHSFGIPEHKIDSMSFMVWEKSEHGDPLCLRLLEKTIEFHHNDIESFEFWPSGRYGLMKKYWEDLSSDDDFICHRFLLLLSILQECGHDFMMASVLEVSPYSIQKIRWKLNIFLEYEAKGYRLSCREFGEYMLSCLSIEDKKNLHKSLIKYYFPQEAQSNYGSLSKEALQYLAYHYYSSEDFSHFFSTILDPDFQKEKQSRFSSIHSSLKDISLVLKQCFETKRYEQALTTGYQYYSMSLSAMKGIEQAFRSASHGDYALALEKLQLLQDEYDLFKGLLLVLWYTIANEDYSQSYRILEEFKRIPDEHIGFYVSGLSNILAFLLEKLKRYGIVRIDTLIGKHGLTGQDAIEYLFGLSEKIHFSYGQLRYFLEVLIATTIKLNNDPQKYATLERILPLWKEMEIHNPSSEVIEQLFGLIFSLENPIYQIKSWKSLSQIVFSLAKKDYLDSIKKKILDNRQKIQDNLESSCLVSGLYALLLLFHQESTLAVQIMQKALDQIRQKNWQDWYWFLVQILPEMEEYKGNPIVASWWENCLTAHKERISIDSQEQKEYKARCTERIASSMVFFGDSSQAFSLLQSDGLPVMEERKNTLKKILRILPALQESEISFCWNMLLGQMERAISGKDQWEMMEEVADFLASKKIIANDLLWNQYLAILEKKPKDYSKDKIYSLVACAFAKESHLTKARSLLSKISTPSLRCRPLAEIAFQLSVKDEWEGSLETIREIPSLKERFSVFSLIAEKIPSGDSGRSEWKKLAIAMLQAVEETIPEEIPFVYWKNIFGYLSQDLPIEECIPLWKDILDVLEKMQNTREALEEIIRILSQSNDYEKTIFFWPVLQSLCEKMPFSCQSRLQTQIARANARLGRLRETEGFLQKAIAMAQKEPDKMKLLFCLGDIAAAYKDLGKEEECRKVFHLICRHTGLEEGKNASDWNPDSFAIYLASLGMEDMACHLLEKLLVLSVETKEEVPLPEALCLMADVCVEAGHYDWAMFLFFRLLPVLSKDYGNMTQEVPLYLRLIALLEKMAPYERFHELWEHMEQMVLNFPKTAMQERCMEKLALTLSKHGFYNDHAFLWEKLLHDANYVGGKLESLKSLLRIGKYFIQAAPLEKWEKQYFSKDSQGIHIFQKIALVSSEYERIHLTEMVAEMLICCPYFDEIRKIWLELIQIPYGWKREECTSLALFQFAKILARHIEKKGISEIMNELLSKIPRLQTKGKACLAIALEYKEKKLNKESLEFLYKAMNIEKQEGNQETLEEILLTLLALGERDFVLSEIASYSPIQKVPVQWELFQEYLLENRKDKALAILEEILSAVLEFSADAGVQTRAYSRAFLCQCQLKNFGHAFSLLRKALESSDFISNSSIKKDAISFLLSQIEKSEVQEIPQEIQFLLIEKAENIEQEIYRLWAMQEVAETLMHWNQFDYVFKVMQNVPMESEVKFRLLSMYAREAVRNNRIEEAFSLLPLWKSYSEKLVFLKNLAQAFQEKADIDNLMRLYLFVPGDFSVLCYLTTRILSVVLQNQGKETFEKWFSMIAPLWGIEIQPER